MKIYLFAVTGIYIVSGLEEGWHVSGYGAWASTSANFTANILATDVEAAIALVKQECIGRKCKTHKYDHKTGKWDNREYGAVIVGFRIDNATNLKPVHAATKEVIDALGREVTK